MTRRLLIFVAVVAALVAVAVWLADRPGAVTIHWLGWRVDTSVPVLIAALLLALAALEGAVWLVRTVLASPGRWLARRRAKRTRQGYAALTDGLAAVLSGDPRQAKRLARRADKLLPESRLTGLLTAQAAELAGDQAEARKRLSAMLERPETAFLGLKGLMQMALKDGERDAALDYARRAWALNPQAEGLAGTLFDLQARAGQWAEAELTLAEARKRKVIAGGDLSRRRAIVLSERARLAEEAKATDEALRLALKAHEADPGLAPPTVLAAELLHRRNKPRKAAAVIESAWKVAPHPVLAEAYLGLAPAETVLQRVKRVERLVKLNPDSPDGHMALAEAALEARLWGQARTHLEAAAAQRPGQKVFTLLARLERDERKDEAAALAWTAKAASAPPEPVWVCGSCGAKSWEWSACCRDCGAVDSLDWQQPLVRLPVPVRA